jgi:hypothetical protein
MGKYQFAQAFASICLTPSIFCVGKWASSRRPALHEQAHIMMARGKDAGPDHQVLEPGRLGLN